MMRKIIFCVLIIFILSVSGCGQKDDAVNDDNGSGKEDASRNDDGNIVLNEQEACSEQGGEWKEFSKGCVDSCAKARNPGDIVCTQAFTYGCDCGPDRCWTGVKCEGA